MSDFQRLLKHLPTELQIEITENALRKDYSELEKARIQRRLEVELQKLIRPGRPSKQGKSVKDFTDNQRVLSLVGSIFGESHTTVHERLHVAGAVQKGDPVAKELLQEVEEKKRSIASASAKLKIYERRQKLEESISNGPKTKLPETIKFGDCFELMKDLPDKSIDAVLSSPPFELAGRVDYFEWFDGLLKALERVAVDYALIFNSSRRLVDICSMPRKPFRILIWDKKVVQEPFRYEPIFVYRFDTARYNVNDRIWADVLEYSPPLPQERLHPDQNPLGLYEQLLGYVAGKRILDPFLGSGTTLRACRLLGKTCVGFEIDETLRPAIIEAGGRRGDERKGRKYARIEPGRRGTSAV
jgi:hypothetical protein